MAFDFNLILNFQPFFAAHRCLMLLELDGKKKNSLLAQVGNIAVAQLVNY